MPFEFDSYVALWVIGTTVAGVVIGYLIRAGQARQERNKPEDRRSTLKALLEILKGVERLTSDMDTHNSEIRNVGRHVGDLRVSGELRDIQKTVLSEITHLLDSNQRMEDDLVVARYQMERQAEELDRTRREARTDPIAGIGNRKAFDETVQWMLTNWKRTGEPFVLIMGDLDRFKWINDTHGHPVGDRVLKQMAELLKKCVREADSVTRHGGDEFAVLLPHTELEAGVNIATRMGGQVWSHSFDLGGKGTQGVVSISLGIAAPIEGDTIETLTHRADRALYRAKELGRNRCCVSTVNEGEAHQAKEPPLEQPVAVSVPQAH